MNTIDANLNSAGIFSLGYNCRNILNASHASLLVDCANYYRALHSSICKAKKSIFVLGWDIDSRIDLLRGEDAKKSTEPTTFFDLIYKKAKENPDLQIYLNKWDFSLLMFGQERELFAGVKWRANPLDNIHYCTDNHLPLGACHHQKIVVIDDEVVFTGGMDIALGRWDHREHMPENDDRADPGTLIHANDSVPFGPYHDIQIVLAGQIVSEGFSKIVRERWAYACNTPLPSINVSPKGYMPYCWPETENIDFENIRVAMALTLPSMEDQQKISDIKNLYIDEIMQAEKFIYIENQFLTYQPVALALNKRLKENPQLRVFLLSCHQPTGIMERKAQWAGRVRFRDILEKDVSARVRMNYPISRVGQNEESVRIHSKIMIVDDKFLHLGSANLNYRSMGVDTECDVVLIAENEKSCKKIAAIRTDLLREHTGRSEIDIEKLIENAENIEEFCKDVQDSRQHVRAINDEKYRHEKFYELAKKISDSENSLLQEIGSIFKTPLKILLFICFITFLGALWKYTPLSEMASVENMKSILFNIKKSDWSFLLIISLFALGGFIMLPVTALIAATAIVFGSFKGFIYAFVGVMVSASIGFWLARFIGQEKINKIIKKKGAKFQKKIQKSGILGVSIIRMIPIAPFSAINILYGISSISYATFFAGTILGLLPGMVIISFLGGSLIKLWQNPDAQSIVYVIAGLIAWVLLIVISHIIGNKLENGKSRNGA